MHTMQKSLLSKANLIVRKKRKNALNRAAKNEKPQVLGVRHENYEQPSGLNVGLDFLISTDWTPEQAWAVVELLDDFAE
jgi:hypothetical protein